MNLNQDDFTKKESLKSKNLEQEVYKCNLQKICFEAAVSTAWPYQKHYMKIQVLKRLWQEVVALGICFLIKIESKLSSRYTNWSKLKWPLTRSLIRLSRNLMQTSIKGRTYQNTSPCLFATIDRTEVLFKAKRTLLLLIEKKILFQPKQQEVIQTMAVWVAATNSSEAPLSLFLKICFCLIWKPYIPSYRAAVISFDNITCQ